MKGGEIQLIGIDFMYEGSSLTNDFEMMMCLPEDEQEFATRTINKGELTSVRPRPNHYGVTYDDTLKLDFFIMKKAGCYKQEDFKMTADELNAVRRWLESSKKPSELILITEEGETGESSIPATVVFYYGIFTSVQPYTIGGECYGLTLEFTCDSPYGYSDEEILSVFINSSGSTKTLRYKNESADKESYIKPKIIITSEDTFGDGETLTITNASDSNHSMNVILPEGLSEIIIDCEKKIITDGSGNLVPMSDIGINNPITDEYNFIATDQYLFYWLSLVYGDNSITVTPSSTNTIKKVTLRFRYIIKSGGFE